MSNNWRNKRKVRNNSNEVSWRVGLYKEFIQFVDETYQLSLIYNWNFCGGGTDNYAVTLSQPIVNGKCISIKMIPCEDYSYYVSFSNVLNPNNIKDDSVYQKCIGKTIDEALKYIHTFLLENKFESKYNGTRNKGNGYDKCFMRIRWEKEELVNKMMEDEFTVLY